jgi:predicted cobalt transporter CbtA
MPTKLLSRVEPSRLRSLAAAAMVVGLGAGIVAAAFASVAGEPSIEQAIAIEQAAAADPRPDAHAAHGAPGEDEEASVARRHQRGIGLFAAYSLTGAAFGVLLAVTVYGLRRGRPDPARRVLLAGVVLAGAFTVAPWLKYPPSPPAVGDPSTLSQRQWLYVALIGIAAVVGLGASMLDGRLRAVGWTDHRRMAVVAAAVVAPMLTAFAALPPAPDPVALPATLVWRFRLASLGANLTLWSVLTLGVGLLVEAARPGRDEAGHRPPLRRPVGMRP